MAFMDKMVKKLKETLYW